ncbi:hypothetical protein GCM10023213_19660 [Prosthecobacter algae]|uniref:Bro-N domain-containing protein n=1 Tax=Prosthecobacter algae TaxID=1144682 RepID=A0ABP9P1W1_9BACT
MTLKIFDFNSQAVRVVERGAEPWFVAADVCRILEISNPSEAIKALDDDEKMTLDNTEGHSGKRGGAQCFNIISESGLYALIFKSRKAEAKSFRKWVTAEVLPSLRKRGEYIAAEGMGGVPDRAGTLPVLRYIEEVGKNWPIERQIEFGFLVRRYSKAMGCVFQVEEVDTYGRCFVFPREILDTLRLKFGRLKQLPDSDAVEMERLLEMIQKSGASGEVLDAQFVRDMAQMNGYFPQIFRKDTSIASHRSAFGKLAEKFNGRIFPSGYQLISRGGAVRKYQINKVDEMALV